MSNCTNAKEMWDTLQLTHEGIRNLKRSRINTLTHEYELFRMNPNENIHLFLRQVIMFLALRLYWILLLSSSVHLSLGFSIVMLACTMVDT